MSECADITWVEHNVIVCLLTTVECRDDETELIEVNRELFQRGLDTVAALTTVPVAFSLQTGYKR